jgi:N-acetylmuramoyl-L-alanine amidase
MTPARRGSPLTTIARGFAVLIVVFLVGTGGADAAPTAQQMYSDTLSREQRVRAGGLTDPDARDSVLADIRSVVAAYQSIVRRFPTSGYSDNALWQAAVLSIDAFRAFGGEADKATALRCLRLLASEYPSSSLVKQIPVQLARANTPAPAAAPSAPRVRSTAPQVPVARRATQPLATIKSIRRQLLPDTVRISIELDHEVPFYEERITGPSRIFVDFASTRATAAIGDKTLRFDDDTDIIRQIRIGRHPDNRTRVVLDATDVASYSIYPLYAPYRLVIDCVRAVPPVVAAIKSSAAKPPPAVPAVARPVVVPLLTRRVVQIPALVVPAVAPLAAAPAAAPKAAGATAAPVSASAATLPAVPRPQLRAADAGYSMARQLGLNVSRIVIDPGHGGHDPGAQSHSMDEAELVLDVALRLEKLLQKVPGVEVILTRRTDEYVALPERTAIANREGADLFLSIHANASANASARGVETYFLNFANNMSAASVAARENAASGQAMGALPDFLKAIALNNKLAESRDLAVTVQDAMVERLRKANKSVKDLGVKQAPFVVLIGAAMPSVLAEISFLTNSQEARLLRSSAYRDRIAEALVDAIQKYQASLQNVARVAQGQ